MKWLKKFWWVFVALVSGLVYILIKATNQNENGKVRDVLDKINITAEKKLNEINERRKKNIEDIKNMSDSELDNKLHDILNGL